MFHEGVASGPMRTCLALIRPGAKPALAQESEAAAHSTLSCVMELKEVGREPMRLLEARFLLRARRCHLGFCSSLNQLLKHGKQNTHKERSLESWAQFVLM